MKSLFYTSSRFLGFIPMNLLIRITGQKIIFPFYHLVSNNDVIHVKHLYRIRNIKEFERDLDFYLKEYNPLPVNEIVERVNKGCLTDNKGFLLSFDDGLREFHEVIAPILLKKGVPAVCFLNTGFMDNKDLFFRYKASVLKEKLMEKPVSDSLKKRISTWASQNNVKFDESGRFLFAVKYHNRFLLDEVAKLLEVDFRDYLAKYQPYLTCEQILSLVRQGFSFGAHSVDHPLYMDLPLDQQLNQTLQSINEISEKFNPEYRLFSFPFTDNEISMEFFNNLFNELKVDLTFGCAGLKKDMVSMNIQRIPVEIGDYSARDIIYSEYIYYLVKAFVHKNIIRRS